MPRGPSQASSQSQSNSSSQRPSKKPRLSASSSGKVKTVKLDAGPARSASSQRFDPLTAFSQSSTQETGWSQQSTKQSTKNISTKKGKEKAVVIPSSPISSPGRKSDTSVVDLTSSPGRPSPPRAKSPAVPPAVDDRLWVDVYEPTTEADLAVHVKKVASVRKWFDEAFEGGPSGKLRKYRRVLALTGPAGSAKTTTVRVLAKEMNFEILEWRNAIDLQSNSGEEYWKNEDYESMISKFESFIARGSSCSNIFSASTSRSSSSEKRSLILLEDLPNVLHSSIQARFQALIEDITNGPICTPIVIVLSDAGTRGEAMDENPGGWRKDSDSAMDIRTVLGRALLDGPYVTQIGYNKIAPTLMRKALQNMLNKHSNSTASRSSKGSKDTLDLIVDSSNGDIRSAVMALQFASITDNTSNSRSSRSTKPKGGKSKKKQADSSNENGRFMIEVVTRREQSLVLFHLLGKVLYNKRKGDSPSTNLTIREKQNLKELDERLPDPPPLPRFLREHERKASRVDVDAIYADSPIDSSLFSLYIQQNYLQFCDDLDQCDRISEYLSWVDAGCGADTPLLDSFNPFRFHLITLGTLNSLPEPVTRRGQKMYKPEFFDALKKQRQSEDGIEMVQRIINNHHREGEGSSPWGRREIASELGGWLNARPDVTSGVGGYERRFWNLKYVRGSGVNGEPLDEDDVVPNEQVVEDRRDRQLIMESIEKLDGSAIEEQGWWKESDDIEGWASDWGPS